MMYVRSCAIGFILAMVIAPAWAQIDKTPHQVFQTWQNDLKWSQDNQINWDELISTSEELASVGKITILHTSGDDESTPKTIVLGKSKGKHREILFVGTYFDGYWYAHHLYDVLINHTEGSSTMVGRYGMSMDKEGVGSILPEKGAPIAITFEESKALQDAMTEWLKTAEKAPKKG